MPTRILFVISRVSFLSHAEEFKPFCEQVMGIPIIFFIYDHFYALKKDTYSVSPSNNSTNSASVRMILLCPPLSFMLDNS